MWKAISEKTFRTPDDLGSQIERAVQPLLNTLSKPRMQPDRLRSLLNRPFQIPNQTSLRFVLAPEREEEVLDPVLMDSPDFLSRVYRVGHAPDIALLSYSHAKTAQIDRDGLIIHQTPSADSRDLMEEVRLEIQSSGLVIIDSNVTGRVRQRGGSDSLDIFVLAHADLEAALRAGFLFCGALFDEYDPYKRHQRFLFAIVLNGIGYRRLEKDPRPRSSYSIGMRSGDRPVVVYDAPRVVDRDAMARPEDELRRVMTILSRDPGLK